MNQDSIQKILDLRDQAVRFRLFPPASAEVMPGIVWGAFDELFTPAFWAARAWLHEPERIFEPVRLGRSLIEEVAACLLGGYGIPAEVGLAAFDRIRAARVLEEGTSAQEIESLLMRPLCIAGRRVQYRFVRQKARHLAASNAILRGWASEPAGDRELRDRLLELPGVGPKTASWITRNWRNSDRVAILDVHVHRACQLMGLFRAGESPTRHYPRLEGRFLAFAASVNVRPAILDNLIWQTMRKLGRFAHQSDRLIPNTAVATASNLLGKVSDAAISRPHSPSGQNPRPSAVATRCSVARRQPASRNTSDLAFL